jgi:hypothetical protein
VLKEGSRAATIGCANLQMKQGRGDDYISASLTSSNSGWHKGWFYLRNDPRVRASGIHQKLQRPVAEELVGHPVKAEQEKILKDHWAVPRRLEEPGHVVGSPRAVPCPGSCAAPEAAASSLRDDGRPGSLDGGRDRSDSPVAA